MFVIVFSKCLSAQPWNLKETFKEAYSKKDDPNYVYKTTIKDGKYFIEAFYNDNPRYKKFDYFEDKATGKKEGAFYYYTPQGQWYCKLIFKEGVLRNFRVLQTDGTIATYTVNNDRLNGVHTSYYPRGVIKEQGSYTDNVRIGNWVYRYENGQVQAEGTYLGDYRRLVYEAASEQLILLDRNLDTLSVQQVKPDQVDSLKAALYFSPAMPFPIHLNYKGGLWNYYDPAGRLVHKEWFDMNGFLVKE